MDELNERLSALLSDPDGMEKIKEMAQNLLGGTSPAPTNSISDNSEIDIAAVTKMLTMIKSNNKDDNRIKLLLALKPNLSDEKQQKVDSAIKILKLVDLAPLLKDAGLFNL